MQSPQKRKQLLWKVYKMWKWFYGSLYFHYIHDITCQKAGWVNSQVDGQTLQLLPLQLPYKSKKGKLLDLQLTLEWTPYPVFNISAWEDSPKGLKWGLRNISNNLREIQLSWKVFHCSLSEMENPEARRKLLTLEPLHYLPLSHYPEPWDIFTSWTTSCSCSPEPPCMSWSSCPKRPFPPSWLDQLFLMLLSSAP